MLTRTYLALFAMLIAVAPVDAQQLEYNRDIRPILSDNCFACHGPDKNKRQAELRLDVRESALEKKAFMPGKVDESALVTRIYSTSDDEIMPPPSSHKKLTDAQKATLKKWIEQGAPYAAHWAYTPLVRPKVPGDAIGADAIDAFISAPLKAHGLALSPHADPQTLYRRLWLDVIGLPPSPQELDDAIAGKKVEAIYERNADNFNARYETVVNALLASPQYGERMAAPWLDVVRYADTVGYHGDQNVPVWAYRDYVIDSFNKNKPFDQFTREQLAGDLFEEPTEEQLIATCFNRLNMMTREGGAQPKEYLAKYQADRVRTVGMAWLGSTLGCCECHDHKFDPFKTKDFYSLSAFFGDMQQWGVYQDYGYTPNPDLAGWSNDHPFPPEAEVHSRPLAQRAVRLFEQMKAEALSAIETEKLRKEYTDWKGSTITGFGALTPTIKLAESKKEEAKKEDEPAPYSIDGIVSVRIAKRLKNVEFRLPYSGRLAALRLEVFPVAEAGDNPLFFEGRESNLKPQWSITKKDGTSTPLKIRHADATFHRPDYANGSAILGVQDGWRFGTERSDDIRVSTWLPETPMRMEEGDAIVVNLPDVNVRQIRFSVSCRTPLRVDLASDSDVAAGTELDFVRSTGQPPEFFKRLKQLEREFWQCRNGRTPVLVTKQTDKPLITRVLARGNWMDESGEIVQPATPTFLPGLKGKAGPQTRLDLAEWLVSRDNPLTARTFVNRLWKQFFGVGLSPQVDDLGAQGEWPTHPELLDWLAVEFIESGWDVKHMVKLIVMSDAYRQSSQARKELLEIDPQNRLLGYQNPRRLEAEMVRDNALAISGLLNLTAGGSPVFPYQPDGYYAPLQFPDRPYHASKVENQYRRGVYTHWQRTFLHPMMASFDAPSREDCIAARTVANTPQQALTLLNDPTFVEAARVFAAEAVKVDEPKRLDFIFARAVGRAPKDAERESLEKFLDGVRKEYETRPEDVKKILGVGQAPQASGDELTLAAWTQVCRVVLNLQETITRY